MAIFGPANILIPGNVDLQKWAVVACDQYTSQKDYWQRVRDNVKDVPSTFHMILPEAELDQDIDKKASDVHTTMNKYLADGIFEEYANSFVYVERVLSNGQIRRGIVGVIDLEAYDYHSDSSSAIRATEQTVVERIPARKRIRDGAPLELSHVLLLANDRENIFFSNLPNKDELPLVYSVELMEHGGKISGWLINNGYAADLMKSIEAYESSRYRGSDKNIIYAVGDGNHSLAAAKACYEQEKNKATPGDVIPQRYAMVELQNIYDKEQKFEPIHRIVKTQNPTELLKKLQETCGSEEGFSILWHIGESSGIIRLDRSHGALPVIVLQDFLDDYLQCNTATIDYIHGEDVLKKLCQEESSIGFCLPALDKDDFFTNIKEGHYPRKTFSMGHAHEKRFYLETRSLLK